MSALTKHVKEANKNTSLSKLIAIKGNYARGANGQDYSTESLDAEIAHKANVLANKAAKQYETELEDKNQESVDAFLDFDPSESHSKVYDIVFSKICENLKAGELPWERGYHTSTPKQAINPITGTVYSGSNASLLFVSQLMGSFTSEKFATYKQWKSKGREIKETEFKNGTPIVFWSKKESKTETTKSGQPKEFMFVRYYTVYNESQLVGYEMPLVDKLNFNPIESAETLIKNSPLSGLRVVHDKQAAFYNPSLDYVNTPKKETYKSESHYYATLFHEFGHATGHVSRLNRDLKNVFGSHAYGREELVAELCSAFLRAESGIDAKIERSTAYCQSWLKQFQNHPKEMLQAFTQATKAADYILNRKRAEFSKAE